MQHEVQNDCNLLQYADDTMVFKSDSNIDKAIASLEQNVKKLVFFFESHRLTINAGKTEFIIFCKKAKNDSMNKLKLKVHNQIIPPISNAKYLGVYLDQNLNYYPNEIKKQSIYKRDIRQIKLQQRHTMRCNKS